VALLCSIGLALTASPATADDAELLQEYSPADASYLAMWEIPQVVYGDRPDSLLVWLNAWEAADGPVEPILRLRILGAVWDGAFTETVYPGFPTNLMDELAAFCLVSDPIPLTTGDLSDAMQRSIALGDAPAVAKVRRDFAEFSMAFADQLLPHLQADSPEEFFCLLYSGPTEQAWALLAGDGLVGTRLKVLRDERVEALEGKMPAFVAVEVGAWSPFNQYTFVGNHALAGLQVGVRRGPWFARMVLESRLGRTERGYLVRSGDILGVSDRFNALLVGGELGRSLPLWGPLSLEGFGGIGLDGVKPLKDEDLVLGALHLDLGAGLHADLDAKGSWFATATFRREWTRPRNNDGTDLWGDAWSVRLAVGLNLEADSQQELTLIKH